MGYGTTFTGSVTIEPPLNEHEIAYLQRFAKTRHMDRELGPYYCAADNAVPWEHDPDVRDRNQPCPDQPGLWCQWVPTADGCALEWNGAGNFYSAPNWMAYLIQTFLMPSARLSQETTSPQPDWYYAPEFEHFTFDHVLDGVIGAEGEEEGDVWQLVVAANLVTYRAGGQASKPITNTSRPQKPDFSTMLVQVKLVGGPEDGEVRRVPLNELKAGVPCPDGGTYRRGQPGELGLDVVDGCLLLVHRPRQLGV